MFNKVLTHSINLALLSTLLLLIALPSFGGSFLVMQPPNLWPGNVAGWQTTRPAFIVEPNRTDFIDLVAFNPQAVDDKTLRERLEIASFGGYLAVYNHLYTLRNTGSQTLTLRARLLEAPVNEPFTQITAVLSPQDQPYFGTLKNNIIPGSTLLEVDEPSLFSVGSSVLVSEEMVGVLAKSGNALVTTPLKGRHNAGDRLYPHPLCVTQKKVISWQTRPLTLAPGEKAYLTFLVRGEENVGYTTQVFPLKFSVEAIY